MAILALNKSTVKLITSTQIITSVFSVVKELVENSLDADAKNIEINLTDNGLSLIEIRDDGCGISAADVPNMAMPHYTSKIFDFSDLDSLTTYGFRGEALNAICRVAEVTVTTKTSQDETAKLYTLDNNGNAISTELSHRFVGTTVRVQKLFENLPVRRQIITHPRKSKLEIKQIENLLKSLSICQPVVRMSYRVNNNLVFLKPSCTNVKEALSHFAGSKVVANLEWIHNEDSEAKLQLMIPKQDLTDLHLVYESNQQYIIINNRPVKYKQFEKVNICAAELFLIKEIINERISDHFGSKAPAKKHPVYLISVTVAPSEIDVNLEPNKTSVLLKNQDIILKKLDKILLEFYNLRDENVRPDMSVSNTSIDTSPEYHDFTQNLATEVAAPVCKKPKLNNNKQRSRDFILDLNTESSEKQKGAEKRSASNASAPDVNSSSVTDRNIDNLQINPLHLSKDSKTGADNVQGRVSESSDRDSLDRILKTFPGPVLSDSDSESIADTEAPRKAKVAPVMIGHAVRSVVTELENAEFGQRRTANGSEPFTFSLPSPHSVMNCNDQTNNVGNGAASNTSNNYCETLSQLPVVDLGEDFDIVAILERPPANKPIKSEEISSVLKNSEDETDPSRTDCVNSSVVKANSTLELWSRGQIPGLKGSTDVSTYNDSKNNPKLSNDSKSKEESNSFTIYHTGFSKFSYEIRSQVLEENPGAALPLIGKIMANRWKELSPEERGYYRDLALEEKRKGEAEKKRLKNKQVSQQESDKNKARLVQMLESMKKTKSNKKLGLNERTSTTWEISIQNVTKHFFSKQMPEEERIIGPLTDEIWAIRSGGKICVINSREVLAAVDPKEYEEKTTGETTESILQSWLREKNADSASIMHTIHNIDPSSV